MLFAALRESLVGPLSRVQRPWQQRQFEFMVLIPKIAIYTPIILGTVRLSGVIREPSGNPAARESALAVRAATGVESRIMMKQMAGVLAIPAAAGYRSLAARPVWFARRRPCRLWADEGRSCTRRPHRGAARLAG